MSAYIVSKAHIDHLITAALYGPKGHHPNWGAYFYDPSTGGTVDVKSDPSAFGTMLWHANHVSVASRYDEPRDAPFYIYSGRKPLDRPSAVATLKAIDGYVYQSCEHGGWTTSTAQAFCDALRSRLISALPGYDEADTWSID